MPTKIVLLFSLPLMTGILLAQSPAPTPASPSSAPATSSMPIYITPFYDSKGPQISVGDLGKKLEAADAKTILQISDQCKKDRDKLRAEAMYVLAIRLYDLGQKDEAVYWFYTAQYRAHMFAAIVADQKPGSPSFELLAAYNSFNQLAGVYLNGYAFGDLPSIQKTLAKVIEEGKILPKFGDLYPELALIPQEKWAENNLTVSKGLADFIDYIKTNADEIRKQRKENGVDGKY